MAEPQPLRVQDKLAFLLALVPYLLDNDGVTVAQAAAHFDLPPERVREAVSLIAVSGVPGESRQYQHGDLFDIDWDAFENEDRIWLTNQVAIDDTPRFSAREAAALIAALQYLSALPENADHDALASLTAKLTRGASTAPSALAVDRGDDSPALAIIRDAVAEGGVLRFDYLNGRDEREERRVEPLRIESVDDSWYLRGWDQTRAALRTFRLDRMQQIAIDPDAVPAARPAELVLPDRLFEPSRDDTTVVIDIALAALPLVADYLGDRPVLDPSPGSHTRVRTRLRIAHLHGLKRLVTARAGLMYVVSPPEARRVVADWAAEGAAQYDDTETD